MSSSIGGKSLINSHSSKQQKQQCSVIGSAQHHSLEEEEEEELVTVNQIVESSKAKYRVMKMLGEGGFGAVYRVCDVKDEKKIYAMKVEKTIETRVNSKLKMEIHILKMKPGNKRAKCHFTKLVDRGKKDTFTFIVMQLVGPSLGDLKKSSTNQGKVYSIGTGLGVASQCLEACEDMHALGFVHRDIKPANFACGLDDKSLIYILDFGISRCILNEKGELKGPRVKVNFKGTLKFASLNCHKNKEMGRGDDCESWLYMFVDLTNPSGLPWKSLGEKASVQKRKEQVRADPLILLGFYKARPLVDMYRYIGGLAYCDTVDYNYIQKSLGEAAHALGISMAPPFDWMK